MTKVKIKNDTSEMITEVARRMNLPVREIQNEFHMYWQDVGIIMSHCLGYGFYVEGFCHFLISMDNVDAIAKLLYSQIRAKYRYIASMVKAENTLGKDLSKRKNHVLTIISELITKIILLDCSIKAYETEVLATYPKKYKPNAVHLKQYIGGIEKHLGMAISVYPITVTHPIQEVFVRSLQSKGLLPNPVFYKSKKV